MLIQPRADLYDRVINRINREEKLMILRKKLILESFGLVMSFFVFIPLTLKLLSDITKSGLMQFLSLLITDFSIVMADIGNYVLSLLESMPTLSLSLTLATLLILVFNMAK
ncbi:MAG: hypothetical protein ABIG60_01715, partial [Patescibacteria group bacterium]